MYSNVKRDSEYINSLLDFMRGEYDIQPTGIVSAKRGYYGETWRVDASVRSYFVKLDYSAAHKGIYERSFPIVEHLCNSGIVFISSIVKTADGRLSTNYDGAVLGVFDWIDGENIKDKHTKITEYQMLAKVYTIPVDGVSIRREDFAGDSADKFFGQWDAIDDKQICLLLEKNRAMLEHKAARLKHFALLCRDDTTGFHITHGDADGNIITNGNKHFIVDWDDPILAPPERDAWFSLWDWAIKAFHNALRQNGFDYNLRPERLAYYGCHSFFFYLNEYLESYLDNGNLRIVDELNEYFSRWIETEIRYAEEQLDDV